MRLFYCPKCKKEEIREDDPCAILYCKGLIEDYNPGGCYYDDTVGLNGDKSDMYERAKKCYEDRKKRGLRRTTSILEQRMNGE